MTPRTYLMAGVAALGAGALALTPVQPVSSQVTLVPQRVVSDMAVSLAAAVDPIQAWVNVFENSAANLQILGDFYMQKPFPLLTTIGANIATYIEELGNGQGGLIPGQIWGNIQKFFNAPYDPGATVDFPMPPGEDEPSPPGPLTFPFPFPVDGKLPTSSGTVPYREDLPPGSNTESPAGFLLQVIQLVAGFSEAGWDELNTAWENLTGQPAPAGQNTWTALVDNNGLLLYPFTPASGQLMGFLSPAIAPWVQLTRSFTAIGEALQAGEILDAVYELINIPANMTNAFLNGLDTPWDLSPFINIFFELPANTRVGLQLGGLLNSQPYNGSLVDPSDPPTEYTTGTLWNSFSVIDSDIDFLVDNNGYGLKNGFFGSVIGLGQYLGEQLLVTPPEPEEATAASAGKLATPAAAVSAPPEAPAPPVVDEVAVAEVAAEPAAEDVSVDIGADVSADLADLEAAVEAFEAAPAPEAAPDAPADVSAATDDGSDDDSGRAASRAKRGAR